MYIIFNIDLEFWFLFFFPFMCIKAWLVVLLVWHRFFMVIFH